MSRLPGEQEHHQSALCRFVRISACDNFLYGFKGTPSACRAVRPWLNSGHRRKVHRGALEHARVPAVGGWG
jgi:hypothetical protein